MSDLIKREDAIAAVQDHFNADGFRGYDDGQKMMDRINALPSAEPKGELIKREDAIEVLQKEIVFETANAIPYEDYDSGCIGGLKKAIRTIEKLPSADRPSGEWQRVDEQPYFRKHYHKVCCSVCHKQGSEKYNYCPNCGARMIPYKGGGEE